MKLQELGRIDKLYFGYEEIARHFGIGDSSAKVTASRYVKKGLLLRLKRNIYVRREIWDRTGIEERYMLANLGQVPSYLSLMTALAHYEITTQVVRSFYESVAIRRTKELRLNGSVFRYTKIACSLYSGFVRTKGFFMATPEKALLDAFYLLSYGRYSLDIASLDVSKIDMGEIQRLSDGFPLRTRRLLRKHGYLKSA